MLRKSTEFDEGWQREIEYLDNEAERQRTRKRIADLNAQRRPIVLPRWSVLLGALAFCCTFWGFAIAFIYPWLHRLLAKAGLL